MPSIQEFTPEFFQQASDAWRKNKISKPDGQFVYKCEFCQNKANRNVSKEKMKCWNHRNKEL